jgi:ADP-ribose pyrophosphatase
MKPYKQISTKVVLQNRWWRYCLDEIELPSGQPGEYHFVLTNGSSMVVPVDEHGNLLLVKQFRYTGKRDSIEFPCGGLKSGRTFEQTAMDELVEETGFKAEELMEVGEFNPCNGLLDEICRVYIARVLAYVGDSPDETESFELLRLSIEEFEDLIQNRTVWDGMTLAAWTLAKPKL